MELTGFCTVKGLNPLAFLDSIEWDLAGSLQQYPLNSTQFAWSQLSGLQNLTGHLVIIKDILIFIAIYIIIESSCQHPLDGLKANRVEFRGYCL